MSTIKSKFFAVALTIATASAFTLMQTVVAPATAYAGVLGSIKNAAKSVGGAVKSTAVGIGSAAKAGASGAKQVVTGVGSKIAGGVVSVGMANAKLISKTYPARKIAIATKGIVRNVQR